MPQHRLYGLRGKTYVTKYRQILAEEGEAIAAAFEAAVSKGKFTLNDLGELCNRFQMPVKLMDDCLPSLTNERYPTGTWERSQQKGVKAKDIGVVWSES